MAREGVTLVPLVVLLLFYLCEEVTSQGPESRLNEGFGLDRHEELILFSCLGVIMLMSVIIVLFLWYVVDRTKDRIRQFERHLPVVVRKFRHDIAAELELENDTGRRVIMVAGTVPAATGEPSVGEARPLEVRSGRISLTAYRPNQDVGVSTDLPGNASSANGDGQVDEERTQKNVPPVSEPTRKRSKAPDGSDSKDFVYIEGEYVPKDFMENVERSAAPTYAYDNPAYDNTAYTTENGDSDRSENNNRNRGKTKEKKRKDDKLTTYESHV